MVIHFTVMSSVVKEELALYSLPKGTFPPHWTAAVRADLPFYRHICNLLFLVTNKLGNHAVPNHFYEKIHQKFRAVFPIQIQNYRAFIL